MANPIFDPEGSIDLYLNARSTPDGVELTASAEHVEDLRMHLAANGIQARLAAALSLGSTVDLILETVQNPAVLAVIGSSLATYIRRNRFKKVQFSVDGKNEIKVITEGMSGREITRLLRQQPRTDDEERQ